MSDEPLIAILAAGESQRLGQPKQLVKIDGESLIRRQCRVAIESRVGPVMVICGCHADACIAQINDLSVTIRHNEQWGEGIASSIREATHCAIAHDVAALLILHVDQYRVTAEDLRSLHSRWSADGLRSCRMCRTRNEEYVGPPVILPAALFDRLLNLRGDEGARSKWSTVDVASMIDVSMHNAIFDLDLPAQLAAIGQETG